MCVCTEVCTYMYVNALLMHTCLTQHIPQSIHPYCICCTKNSINVYTILFLIVLFIFLQITFSTAFIVGSIKSYLILY